MKIWTCIKRFLKLISAHNGLIAVFIAILALWVSISNNKAQNKFNTQLYEGVDSLRILTSRMLEKQIESEKAEIMPVAFSMKHNINAQDKENIYPLLKFQLKNYGYSPATIKSYELLLFTSGSAEIFTYNSDNGFIILKGTSMPLDLSYPVLKSKKIVSYAYVKCFWQDNITNDIDSVEVMQSFTFKKNNTFLISQVGNNEKNEILKDIKNTERVKLTSEFRNKYYSETKRLTILNNK